MNYEIYQHAKEFDGVGILIDETIGASSCQQSSKPSDAIILYYLSIK
jgi:hypothetical protein